MCAGNFSLVIVMILRLNRTIIVQIWFLVFQKGSQSQTTITLTGFRHTQQHCLISSQHSKYYDGLAATPLYTSKAQSMPKVITTGQKMYSVFRHVMTFDQKHNTVHVLQVRQLMA